MIIQFGLIILLILLFLLKNILENKEGFAQRPANLRLKSKAQYFRFIPDEQKWSYQRKNKKVKGYEKPTLSGHSADIDTVINHQQELDSIWKERAAERPRLKYNRNTLNDVHGLKKSVFSKIFDIELKPTDIKPNVSLEDRNRKFVKEMKNNEKMDNEKLRIKKVLRKRNEAQITSKIYLPKIVTAEDYYRYHYNHPFVPFNTKDNTLGYKNKFNPPIAHNFEKLSTLGHNYKKILNDDLQKKKQHSHLFFYIK